MKAPHSLARLLAIAALLAGALGAAGAASADSAVVAHDGTLYEVFPTSYGNVIACPPGSPDASLPVLALRVTSQGQPRTELVDGTVDPSVEGSVSIDLEEETGTLFVAYTKSAGLMTDMHVAVRRNEMWLGQDILPSRGLYLSINPKVVGTRQTYTDFDRNGNPTTKTRSIFWLIWWEESGPSQARLAAIFVEDGALRLDAVQAWNVNDLAGSGGRTDTTGLPLASFSFPSLQPDPTTNGGVLATYANLAVRKQQVLRLAVPDDLVKLSPPGAQRVPDDVLARAHVPIGRIAGQGRLPIAIDTLSDVTAFASQKGVTTFSWLDGSTVSFVRTDDADGAAPHRLALRDDLSAEKALRLVRTLAEKD